MYSMVMARLDDAPLACAIADVPGVKLLLGDAWKATVPVPEADKTTSDRIDELFMVGRAVLPLCKTVQCKKMWGVRVIASGQDFRR
jgi:hypothetical protein